jgi:hypothetical protein
LLVETCDSGNPVVSDDHSGSLDRFRSPLAIAPLYRCFGLEVPGQRHLGYCWFYEHGGRFKESVVKYGPRKSCKYGWILQQVKIK